MFSCNFILRPKPPTKLLNSVSRWNNLYLLWGHFARHSRCGHDEDVEDPVDAELLEDIDPAPVGAEVLEEALQLRKLLRHALVTNSPS